MREYLRHIEEYYNHPWAHFSFLVPESQWGDKALAEMYLEKYWLTEQEYIATWQSIQDRIFVRNTGLPDQVFQQEFELVALRGGCLMTENVFRQIQDAVLEIGDDHLIVIQHSQEFTSGEPMFRMKFPINIQWKELVSGNYISAVLLEMSLNEYHLFSESGNWGMYCASDYKDPLKIVACRTRIASRFIRHIIQSAEEKRELTDWLPTGYKERMYVDWLENA